MGKILIIEDEDLIREELEILLSNEGYRVESAAEFHHVTDLVKSFCPDLILLDLNLPDRDGYRLCADIRSFTDTPIMFITGRDTSMDELYALTVGGDDYVSKPYNVPILLARIRLLLKRGKAGEQAERLEYKGIRLNLVSGTLSFKGQETELTKTELKIIYYLFSHTGEIVSRMDLVEFLWDNQIHIDDNTLSVNIMRIREKLSGLGAENLIQTKRGMGYKI